VKVTLKNKEYLKQIGKQIPGQKFAQKLESHTQDNMVNDSNCISFFLILINSQAQ